MVTDLKPILVWNLVRCSTKKQTAKLFCALNQLLFCLNLFVSLFRYWCGCRSRSCSVLSDIHPHCSVCDGQPVPSTSLSATPLFYGHNILWRSNSKPSFVPDIACSEALHECRVIYVEASAYMNNLMEDYSVKGTVERNSFFFVKIKLF